MALFQGNTESMAGVKIPVTDENKDTLANEIIRFEVGIVHVVEELLRLAHAVESQQTYTC